MVFEDLSSSAQLDLSFQLLLLQGSDFELFELEGNRIISTEQITGDNVFILNVEAKLADLPPFRKIIQFGFSAGQVLEIDPMDLLLADQSIAENNQLNDEVGEFEVLNIADNSYTIQFVDNAQFPDNTAFTLMDRKLLAVTIFDYEFKNEYVIKLELSSPLQPNLRVIKEFTIKVEDVEEPPVQLFLTDQSINENNPVDGDVGDFQVLNLPDENYTISLIDNDQFPDNVNFKVVNNKLVAAITFDFETKESYQIKIELLSSIYKDLKIEREYTISIGDVSEPMDYSNGRSFDPDNNQGSYRIVNGKTGANIVGMGAIEVAGEEEPLVYVYYDDGTYSTGRSFDPDNNRGNYSIPNGKTPNNIVGIGIIPVVGEEEPLVHVYFDDGTYTTGRSFDPDNNEGNFSLPNGKSASNIVGVGIVPVVGDTEPLVYVYYDDGTYSTGRTFDPDNNQGDFRVVNGKSPSNVKGVGIIPVVGEEEPMVYLWYNN